MMISHASENSQPPPPTTPLIAARAIDLLHQAGVPRDVVQLLPGSGAFVGAALERAADFKHLPGMRAGA